MKQMKTLMRLHETKPHLFTDSPGILELQHESTRRDHRWHVSHSRLKLAADATMKRARGDVISSLRVAPFASLVFPARSTLRPEFRTFDLANIFEGILEFRKMERASVPYFGVLRIFAIPLRVNFLPK